VAPQRARPVDAVRVADERRLGAATFTAYSTSHLVVLAVFVAGTVGLLTAGPRLRGRPAERTARAALAVATLAFGVASTVSAMVPWHLDDSLPLQICDLAWVVVGWALLTGHPTASALTYFWGLTLGVQALVQPTLTSAFPTFEFFAFWGKHLLIVWGAVLWTLALRHGPDWRAYRVAVGWTSVWLVVVLGLNGLLGTNYGYVNGKPSEATVLDVLGPWPVYVVAEMAIVAAGWALITLPWVGRPVRR
jgi:hypothetical integral membrane protein (TIGR02206 family)